MLRIADDALTFDDVLLLPAYSNVLPSEVSLGTRLTKDIRLNIPVMSSAMDTVTEARLAIALAQEGGIGIVHKNMSIEAQAREVRAVKKHESGIIRDPITIRPDETVAKLIELTLENEDIINIQVGDSTPDRQGYYIKLQPSRDVYTVDYTWFDVVERLVLDPPYPVPEEEED